jgi:hypothetical protein
MLLGPLLYWSFPKKKENDITQRPTQIELSQINNANSFQVLGYNNRHDFKNQEV